MYNLLMNVISSTTMRANFSSTLDELDRQKYLLVARRGKISHAIVNLDFLEDLLALNKKEYLVSIRQAREDYKKGRVLSHDQVFGEL
jgi:hypothetical protein